MFVLSVLKFLQLLSVQVTVYKMLSKINIIFPLWPVFIMRRSSQMTKVSESNVDNLLVAVVCGRIKQLNQ